MTSPPRRTLAEIVAALRQAADIWFSADLHRTLEELIAIAEAKRPVEPAREDAREGVAT